MSTNLETAEVTLRGDTAVSVARSFKAPRALVYEAYTTPALMQRWLLGYPGWTMPVCEMDVRPGGRFRWRWRSDEGNQEFGFHGEFVEVDAPRKLRHTEIFDPGDTGENMGEGGAMVTVEFDEEGATTTARTLIEYASREDRDAAMSTGMTDGMEESYKKLDAYLEERVAA